MAVSLDQGYYISLRGSTRVLFLESKKGQHYAFAFARKAAKEKKGYVQRLVKAGNNVSSEAEPQCLKISQKVSSHFLLKLTCLVTLRTRQIGNFDGFLFS